MLDPWDALKLIADPTRLRVVNLLCQEELSVAELQEILDMGQSRISSHLGLLRQGEIVTDRKDGKRHYYAVNPALDGSLRSLLACACDSVKSKRELQEDQSNLERVITKRRREIEQYFNEIAGRLGKNYCPGRSWEAMGHFLLHLVPAIRIADLGAGEGMLAQLLARESEMVYCIDSSKRMVEVGSELAEKNNITNLKYILGDIESVPLKNKSVHVAYLSQALHHAIHPEKAIEEAYRILKPGGKIMILDLKEHQFEKTRELYADRWLGFSENFLYKTMNQSGFVKVEVNTITKESQEPYFETILGTAHKPE